MLGEPPAHLRACFRSVVAVPRRELTRDQVVRLISAMRRAELNKNECGRQLLAWADDQKRLLGGAERTREQAR